MNDALEDTFTRQLFAAAADPMLVMDASGTIMLSNPTAQRLFGYPEQKLAGLPVEALLPERYRGRHRMHRAEYAREPRRRPMGLGRDLYGLRRDGSEFAAEISLSPLDGGLVLATIQDVTERKRTEAALRKFSRVIEQTASTVVITDASGVIEYVNPRFVETTGYAAEEAVGKQPSLLKSGHTTAEEHEELWRTITGGGVWNGEFLNRRKDGSLYWESAIISPIRNERGQITHFVGIKDDITARKDAEATMRELRAEMERLLALHVASQTAAAIAHELNQPLNAVSSYTEAALRMLRAGNPKPEKLQHALENSALQAQRAGRVVRELLLLLQKSESSTELVDLNEAAHHALAIIEADGYGFRATLELAAELKPVVANRLQVEKVLVNLLRNSLEAMRNAGVRGMQIAIRTAAEGDVAHVTVRDNGPGLNKETESQIFEPFFTTKPTGLGMGLTISRTLIEAHGGKLWSDIMPDPGATFHFTLPFAS